MFGKNKEKEYLEGSLQSSPFPEYVNPAMVSDGTRQNQQAQQRQPQQIVSTRPQVVGEITGLKNDAKEWVTLTIAVPRYAKNSRGRMVPTSVNRLTLDKVLVIQ